MTVDGHKRKGGELAPYRFQATTMGDERGLLIKLVRGTLASDETR